MNSSYSCFSGLVIAGLLCSFAAGCAASHDEAAAESEQAATAVPTQGICSDPVPTADGQWLLLDVCPTGGQLGHLVARKLNEVTTLELASYPATSKIVRIVANGEGYAAALSRPAEGTFEVLAGKWSAPGGAFRLDVGAIAGAKAEAPKALHVSADGKWVMGVSGATSVAFVSQIAPGAVPVSKDLRSGSDDHRFLSKGNKALLMTGRSEQNSLGRTFSLGGTPAIGEPVDLGTISSWLVAETYDGDVINATTLDNNGSLLRVDLTTGQSTVVAHGDDVANPYMSAEWGAGYFWFSNQSRVYDELENEWSDVDTLQRVRPDGSGGVEDFRSVKGSRIRFLATTGDGQHVVYLEGDDVKVASTTPGGTARTIGSGLDHFEASAFGDRLAISFKERMTGAYSAAFTTLVLDASGAVVGELEGIHLGATVVPGQLSGDGKVFYTRSTNSPLEGCKPLSSALQSCDAGFGKPIVIPGSSAVVTVMNERADGIHRPREVTIVLP